MYFVVQGQVIMLIALSRASCKLFFFICVEIVQLFEVMMILCFFFLVNKSCSKAAPEDRGVGLREDRAPGEKTERRGVSSNDSPLCSSGE